MHLLRWIATLLRLMRLNASLHVTLREFRSIPENVTQKMFAVFVSV